MSSGLSARRLRRLFSLGVVVAGGIWTGNPAASDVSIALSVQVTPPFINPSLGQSATIALAGVPTADVTIEILDRDRFVIRTLKPAGASQVVWDGRDESGEIVPDEAYALRIVRIGSKGSRTVLYDPSAAQESQHLEVEDITYSRQQGILNYTLPAPARVHVQAAQAVPNSATGEFDGPILKTLIDRQPRAAGAIVETWNGRDESGVVYVPDLPGFAIAVAAASLPENSLITVGNRHESFIDYARRRSPAEALRPRRLTSHSRDHMGLTAFEDRSPALEIAAEAPFGEQHQAWVAIPPLRLRVHVEPAVAPYFLLQPTELSVFLDSRKILTFQDPGNPAEIAVPHEHLPPGDHHLVVNWASGGGPLGVQTLRVHVPEPGIGAMESSR